MTNPWNKIPAGDYENHMDEIGQLTDLNLIFKDIIKEFAPRRLALLGVATGNGLEHIQSEVTSRVHCVDINREYLQIVKKRYHKSIPGLQMHCIDLNQDDLIFSSINLVFASLFLEYVDPNIVIPKIGKCLDVNGFVVIVLQKGSSSEPFVSKSRYNSLQALSTISKEITEKSLHQIFLTNGLKLLDSKSIPVKNGKQFVVLTYSK